MHVEALTRWFVEPSQSQVLQGQFLDAYCGNDRWHLGPYTADATKHVLATALQAADLITGKQLSKGTLNV